MSLLKTFLSTIIRTLEIRAPFLIDRLRQALRTFLSRLNGVPYPYFYDNSKVENTNSLDSFFNNSQNILFFVHWFETGGAESFALERMQHYSQVGKNCFVMATVPSLKLKINLFEKVCKIAVPLFEREPIDQEKIVIDFIKENAIDTIYIHHSHKAYELLNDIKMNFPEIKTIDSTHIIEPINGGFVLESIQHSKLLDMHHVITPSLYNFYKKQKVDESKLCMFPLSYMSLHQGTNNSKKENEILKFIFIGRLVQQKRPYYFLKIAKALEHYCLEKGLKFQFDMYGSGNKMDLILALQKRFKIQNFNVHGESNSLDKIFDGAFALVLPSDNEGLPLVCFEATRYGVYSFVTNVGQIEDYIPKEFLVNASRPMDLVTKIIHSIENPEMYIRSYSKQLETLRKFELLNNPKIIRKSEF